MEAIKQYSDKVLEMELFKKNNKELFAKYEELQKEKEELKKQVVEEIKTNRQDYEDDVIQAKFVPKFKKYYDINSFLATAEKPEYNALSKAKGIKTEIDKKVFEELYKQGLISQKTKQASFIEEPMSESVIIKELI